MTDSRALLRTVTMAALIVAILICIAAFAPQAQADSSPTLQLDCGYLNRAVADPIAHTEHLHEFYGNEAIADNSTHTSLVGQPTTCNILSNTSSYWHPAIRNEGVLMTPQEVTNYNRNPGTNPRGDAPGA